MENYKKRILRPKIVLFSQSPSRWGKLMRNVMTQQYDYHVYADASGCDGFNFSTTPGQGSTPFYVTAVLITKPEHDEHNNNVLYKIKSKLVKKSEIEKTELKYSTIRKSRKSDELHGLLSEIKGTIYLSVSYKRKIKNPVYTTPGSKELTTNMHYFSISEAYKTLKDNEKAIVYIDNMKKVEEDKVLEFVKTKVKRNEKDVTINYEDSKKIKGIQLCDFISGCVRHFLETLENTGTYAKLPCMPCAMTRKFNFCEYKRKKKPLEFSSHIRKILPLVGRTERGSTYLSGIIPYPIENSQTKFFYFFRCLLENKNEQSSG